jgi:hypothetical protein
VMGADLAYIGSSQGNNAIRRGDERRMAEA